MIRRQIASTIMVLAMLGVWGSPARAQPATVPASPGSPWVAGVSEAEQATALDLYNRGNAEFQSARFAQALALYSEAVKHWDHPAIHFNIAVCLINLDQPLDAKQHLERAMQYGEEPLGHDLYMQGITYRHSLDGQIARVRITCSEPDTTVTLDGVLLFTAPGEAERLVLPGKHQVVGIKPGYMTATEMLDLLPARLTKYDVHLLALKPTVRFVQRWDGWKPWAVVVGGAALTGLGGIAYVMAKHDFDRYDTGIATQCPHGCDAAMVATLTSLNATKSSGTFDRDLSYSLFAIGGAVAVTGVVGLILNLPRRVEQPPMAPTVSLVRGGAAVTFGWSY